MNRFELRQLFIRASLVMFLSVTVPVLALGQFVQPHSLSVAERGKSGWQPHQQRPIQDAKGFRWDVDANGNVSSNSQAFSSAGQIIVNNSGFGVQQRLMTADATQFRFTGVVQRFPFTREIKLNQKTGTARFLDTFANPLPQPQTLAIRLTIVTRSSNAAAITSGGQVFQRRAYSGVIPLKQYGFVTQTQSSSYPTPVVFLCGAKGKVRPSVANTSTSNQSFQVNYSVTIPAGKSATLLWGLAQHPRLTSTPQPAAVAALFKPFLAAEFTRGIPSDIRRQIVNNSLSASAEGSFGPLLDPLNELADTYAVERGEKSVLIVGDESHVPGKFTDGPVEVVTRLGDATLAMTQVAGLTGGGGVGRQPRVFLRSGEVLAGTVDLADVEFDAENGLQFKLDSDHILALLTTAAKSDGQPAAERTQWLQTQFGDRVELQPDANSVVHGASMWGPVLVPLAEVKVLARSEEELPVHYMELQDGSKFWLILQGESLEVASKTLGKLSVPVAMIDRVGTVEPAAKEEEPEETPATSAGTGTTPAGTATPAVPTPPARPVPQIRLAPPESLTAKFRDSLEKSLAGVTKALEQIEKDAGAKPDDTDLIQRQFDMVFQIAELQARLGKYADSMKNIKKAMAMKGLDPRRSSRVVYLMGLEAAVSPKIPVAPTPAPAKPEDPRNTAASESPEGTESEVKESTDSTPVKKVFAVWSLAGENKAAAVFQDKTVNFLAATGETTIQTADIRLITRLDEQHGRISFSIELKDGSRVSGRFRSTVLSLTFHGQPWSVPARHVTEFKQPAGATPQAEAVAVTAAEDTTAEDVTSAEDE